MTRKRFYEMAYQDQWFYLVEWTTKRYLQQPYLYYALKILVDTYSHSSAFDAAVLNDLHYEFNAN